MLSLFLTFAGTLISISNTWLGTAMREEQMVNGDGGGSIGREPWLPTLTKEQSQIIRQVIMCLPLAAGAVATFSSSQNFSQKWGASVSGRGPPHIIVPLCAFRPIMRGNPTPRKAQTRLRPRKAPDVRSDAFVFRPWLAAAAQIVAEIYKFRAHVGEYDQLAIALADTSLSIAETAGLPRQRFVQVTYLRTPPASTG